jgi:hypothetical protein
MAEGVFGAEFSGDSVSFVISRSGSRIGPIVWSANDFIDFKGPRRFRRTFFNDLLTASERRTGVAAEVTVEEEVIDVVGLSRFVSILSEE